MVTGINATNDMTTFYVKDSTSNKGIFDTSFKAIELPAGEHSEEISHKWIFKTNKSQFATKKSITERSKVTTYFNLSNNHQYWAIAWLLNNNNKISLIEKSHHTNTSSNFYNVRIFSSAVLNISNINNDSLGATEIGVASIYFSVSHCDELKVGGNNIDLCQIANLGQSYIAVVDSTGTIIVVEE
jgi:hypothetical protein